MDDRVFGIARGVENLQLRTHHLRGLGNLSAIHAAGQDHVGQEQVDIELCREMGDGV